MKLTFALIVAVALLVAASAFAAGPKPDNGYHRLYFCADEQGHLTYIENDRQIDCPGRQEILVMLGTEIQQP